MKSEIENTRRSFSDACKDRSLNCPWKNFEIDRKNILSESPVITRILDKAFDRISAKAAIQKTQAIFTYLDENIPFSQTPASQT